MIIIIFISLFLLVFLALLCNFLLKKKKKNKENDVLRKMIESIDYKNKSMEFDIDFEDINQLHAAKKILEMMIDSNLSVLQKDDLLAMLMQINKLIDTKLIKKLANN